MFVCLFSQEEVHPTNLKTNMRKHSIGRTFPIFCPEEVSELSNLPVVCLFGTRMNGTRTKVVTKGVYPELPCAPDDGHDKESL
jgi:hypothetical protein